MLHQYPFVRLLLPLIAGITAAIFSDGSFVVPEWCVYASFFLVMGLALLPAKHFHWKKRWIFGCTLFIFLFISGYILTDIRTVKFSSTFFDKYYTVGDLYTAQLTEPLQEKENAMKAVVNISRINKRGKWIPVDGKAIIYLQKDSRSSALTFGNTMILDARLSPVQPPANPWQFNYRRYLADKGIYHQAYAKTGEWHTLNTNNASPLYAFACRLREKFLKIFDQNGIKGKEYAVGSALILGCTDHLDADIMKEYSGSGAMHILSVSGLHVGVIYLVMNYLLYFMNKPRRVRLVKELILFALIWFYALLTGLSPAVLRATAMLSFVIVGNALNRNANIYNSLAASAFFLLLINPRLITDAGFQLSYLAVAGIVLIQRNIYNLWLPQNRLLDQIWKLVAISIAAQLTTFPLSLFYFHQFPNYFLITNLIAIPLSSLVIYAGMLVLITAPIGFISLFLSHLMVWLLIALNFTVKYIEELPFAIFQHVFISDVEMLLCYVIIFSLIAYVYHFKKIFLRFAFVGIILMVSSVFIRNLKQVKQQKFIVYSVKKSAAYDFIDGKQHLFLADTSLLSNTKALAFNIQNNWIALGLRKHYALPPADSQQIHLDHILKKDNYIQLGEQRIAIIDSRQPQIALPWKLNIDYLIISHNPRTQISNLLNEYQPRMIIFDSSNPEYQIKKWQKECQNYGLPSYSVPESGAFVKDI